MKESPLRPEVNGGNPRRLRMPMHRAQRWMADGENGRTPALRVFVTQTAFKAINNHAVTDMDNEVGGWLAGRWCRDIDTDAEFIVVEALLPAQQVRAGNAFLTFTHDSQVAMMAALEERFANKGIVGWYHTHPRMGVFLSGYDTWLHNHFFPHPWQVALVIEPHSHVGGFFIRNKNQELDARRYFGFFELFNRNHDSIVDWRNLRSEKKSQEIANIKEKAVQGEPYKEETKKNQQQASSNRTASAEGGASPSKAQPIAIPPTVPAVKPGAAKPDSVSAGVPNPIKPENRSAGLEKSGSQTTQEAPPRVDARPNEQAGGGTAKANEPPILRKFEGPLEPAKISLIDKEVKKKSVNQVKPSEEAKP